MDIGIRPELCSKGSGSRGIGLAVQESRHLYRTKTVYLDVRKWNHRVVKCYASAGFRSRDKLEQETYAGSGGFLRMSYDFNE
ncbi:hypothetical protein [Eisenbergiella sp.]